MDNVCRLSEGCFVCDGCFRPMKNNPENQTARLIQTILDASREAETLPPRVVRRRQAEPIQTILRAARPAYRLLTGDSLAELQKLPPESVDQCITSPPYWGLCDYEEEGQLGGESTLPQYIETMVAIFREVKRVLKNEGTLWLNIGDRYASGNTGGSAPSPQPLWNFNGAGRKSNNVIRHKMKWRTPTGYKAGDLIQLSSNLADALRVDGWYLRQKIVWYKPNPMRESVEDRPIKSYEYVFLLSKSRKYFYDSERSREPANGKPRKEWANMKCADGKRYPANVWTIPVESGGRNKSKGNHPCPFPPQLVERCIIHCPFGGTILDPFSGTATTGLVAMQHGRNYIGIDLNPRYNRKAAERLDECLIAA